MSILYTYIIMKLDLFRLVLCGTSVISLVLFFFTLIEFDITDESDKCNILYKKFIKLMLVIFFVSGILSFLLPSSEQAIKLTINPLEG